VKRQLLNGLKEQKLFNLLYKEIAWTGSYYEGLKISDPDEFDLNIVFKMPDKNKLIEVSLIFFNIFDIGLCDFLILWKYVDYICLF